jgi:signal-transduction protein with cAMP-binding, CBS, and nucleotidyltransferase domain
MESPIKTPEQLLQYRTLQQILADKPFSACVVGPNDSVFSALQLMADKNIGFVVVEENEKMVGVLSERDYARKVILRGRSSKDMPVHEIMTAEVVTVTPEHTVPQCMALMHAKNFRHLPVVAADKVLGVLSIRDLLKETVAHHERLIRDIEIERLTMSSGGSSY